MSTHDTSNQDIDYRFSLANERTYLAWLRTAVALIAVGLVAAKLIDYEHEAWRWAIALPPIIAGAVLAIVARRRWEQYETAMRAGARLPVGGGFWAAAVAIAIYAVVVLVAVLAGA